MSDKKFCVTKCCRGKTTIIPVEHQYFYLDCSPPGQEKPRKILKYIKYDSLTGNLTLFTTDPTWGQSKNIMDIMDRELEKQKRRKSGASIPKTHK